MKLPNIRRLLPAFLLLAVGHLATANVVSHEFPPDFPRSGRYTAKVDGQEIPALQTERGAFLSFGMNRPVEIEVATPRTPRNVVIRPPSAGIEARVGDGFIHFIVPRPLNLSIELDGDLDDTPFVFANPVLPAPPGRDDPKVRYFEGGKIHDAGEILLGDGESLYLEGGAVVRAVVRARRRGHPHQRNRHPRRRHPEKPFIHSKIPLNTSGLCLADWRGLTP